MKIIPDFFLEIQKYMEIPHQLVTCHPQGLAAGSSPRVRIRLRFTWRCELLSLGCWVEKNEWGVPVLGIKQKIPLQAPSKMVFVFPWPEWMLRGYFRGLRTLLTAKHAESFVKDVKAGSFWVPSSSIRRSKSRKMLDHKRFWTVISGMVKQILYFVWSPPWHLYIFLLANLLAFYLTYLLAFYLANLLAFYLAYLLAFYLTYLLAFYLAYLLAFYLTYLLAFYLAYLLAYILANLLAFYLTYLLAFYLANLLAFYLAHLLAFYLTYLLAFYLAFHLAYLLAFYLAVYLAYPLAYLLAFYLAYLLAFYLAYLMAFSLAYLLAFDLTYLLAFYLAVEVQRCTLSWAGPRLRSSGAHWAGQVPGWGPAVHTELGSSQVEVQRCTLSWAARRLRSSGAHWAGQLAGWRPAVRTELGSWRRAWRWVGKVGKAEVEVEEAEARRTASRGGGGGGGGGGQALW